MAEEKNVEEVPKKGMSPLIKNVILYGVAALVPAIIAFVAFNMFLKPKLVVEPPEDDLAPQVELFPAEMTEFKFEEQRISVQMDDPEMVAPLLIEQVTFMCRDAVTAATVESKKSLFSAMILKMHQGRTRSELNDPLVKNSILEQIKQQANNLLRRINDKDELLVLDVLHLQYMMVDL